MNGDTEVETASRPTLSVARHVSVWWMLTVRSWNEWRHWSGNCLTSNTVSGQTCFSLVDAYSKVMEWMETAAECSLRLTYLTHNFLVAAVNSLNTKTFPLRRMSMQHMFLKPPTTSCNPAPPSMTWDARHGPVRWRPTGSFGDRLRHCSRLQTLPYSPDKI